MFVRQLTTKTCAWLDSSVRPSHRQMLLMNSSNSTCRFVFHRNINECGTFVFLIAIWLAVFVLFNFSSYLSFNWFPWAVFFCCRTNSLCAATSPHQSIVWCYYCTACIFVWWQERLPCPNGWNQEIFILLIVANRFSIENRSSTMRVDIDDYRSMEDIFFFCFSLSSQKPAGFISVHQSWETNRYKNSDEAIYSLFICFRFVFNFIFFFYFFDFNSRYREGRHRPTSLRSFRHIRTR